MPANPRRQPRPVKVAPHARPEMWGLFLGDWLAMGTLGRAHVYQHRKDCPRAGAGTGYTIRRVYISPAPAARRGKGRGK